MAELDPQVLKEKCAEQIGMGVFEKLAQIDDVNERNELLKDAGQDNFNWQFTQAMRRQKTAAVLPEAKKRIREAKGHKVDRSATWSGDYDKIGHSTYLYDWDGKSDLIPKAAREAKEWFYYLDGSELAFYTKHQRAAPVKKTEEEKAKEKRVAEAWAMYREDTKTAAELRQAFVNKLTVTKATWFRHFIRMIEAASLGKVQYVHLDDRLYKLYGVFEETYNLRAQKMAENTLSDNVITMENIPQFILAFYEGDKPEEVGYGEGWQKEVPHHVENVRLDQCYEWLLENKYQMSDMEKQLRDGTHPCFTRDKQ